MDGQWCYDPDLATRIDEHGNVNNVLKAELPRLDESGHSSPVHLA